MKEKNLPVNLLDKNGKKYLRRFLPRRCIYGRFLVKYYFVTTPQKGMSLYVQSLRHLRQGSHRRDECQPFTYPH
jgi:hypothetical protein